MDPTTQGLLLTLLGVVIGALTVLAWRVSESELRGPVETGEPEAAVVPPGVATVLSVLRSSALVVDDTDQVLQASAPAYALGLVRSRRSPSRSSPSSCGRYAATGRPGRPSSR